MLAERKIRANIIAEIQTERESEMGGHSLAETFGERCISCGLKYT